jgi:photosystem II stability/assembly factor-like uncharacterized protein
VYVAGPSCNAYKSTDGAAHWRAVFGNDHPNSLFEDCASSIAIGPTGTLYVDTASGFFKSTDGGGSWNRIALDRPGIATVAPSPADPEVVYVGAARGSPRVKNGGVYKSSDGGQSWRRVGLRAQDVGSIAVTKRGRLIYASTSSDERYAVRLGVYESRDGGATWGAAGFAGREVSSLAVDVKHPTTIYAVGLVRRHPCCREGVYRSDDEGRRWTSLDLQSDVSAVVTDPRRPSRLYAGARRAGRHAGGVFQSRDGGKTWELLGLSGKEVWTLTIDPAGHVLYAATQNGAVFRVAITHARS